MKKIIFGIFSILFILNGSSKYAGEFITGSMDPRSLALGNNILTSFSDATAAYYNPSFMPELEGKSLFISHSERFEGLVNQEFIGFTTKMDNHYLGFTLIRLGVDDIPLTKLDSNEGGVSENNRPSISKYVDDNEIALGVSYGFKYNEKFNFGGSAKILYKGFEEESAYGVGFDISALYKFDEKNLFAAKIQDVTTSSLFWTTGSSEFIKPSIYFGGEYNLFWEYMNANVKLLGGGRIGTEGYDRNSDLSFSEFDLTFNGGVEFLISEVLILRGGTEMERWGCGVGVTMYGAELDYSFKPNNNLGDTHKVSLSYNWK
ncbi:MAG: hypothetical protein CR982_06105 [Candidatus Cloacimonadota bacterium]|nr:MAG: hypothetical protein CR982_06105 [Candidatus Cloacimonadota bacterium]PIE78093.1 MAG: hypothetical protein CSA15_09665 [Candidatus Delongbacteria bacterium]